MTAIPAISTPAPDFTLLDQEGSEQSLAAFKGQVVLIYFYPKDDTLGCTKEACAIRDAFPQFNSSSITVLGISPDSPKSHKKFAEKYQLPFTLLSDEDHAVAEAYGVWGAKKFMGRNYDGVMRTSFLIGSDGTILKVYEKVKPEVHAEEVLKDVAELGV